MSRSGMFGWSYPPGCSGPPGDEPLPPCGLCGKDVEDSGPDGCKCPPCEMCGDSGCLTHLDGGELAARWIAVDVEIRRRQVAQTKTCQRCGEKLVPTLPHLEIDHSDCQVLRWEEEEYRRSLGYPALAGRQEPEKE